MFIYISPGCSLWMGRYTLLWIMGGILRVREGKNNLFLSLAMDGWIGAGNWVALIWSTKTFAFSIFIYWNILFLGKPSLTSWVIKEIYSYLKVAYHIVAFMLVKVMQEVGIARIVFDRIFNYNRLKKLYYYFIYHKSLFGGKKHHGSSSSPIHINRWNHRSFNSNPTYNLTL